MITKWCGWCEQDLALSAFGLDRSRGDGLAPYCKTCRSTKRTALRKERGQAVREARPETDAEHSWCRSCRRVLHISKFTPSSRGLQCAKCNRDEQARQRGGRKLVDSSDAPDGHSWCYGCSKYLPLLAFYRRANGATRTRCKACESASRNEWLSRNPGYVQGTSRRRARVLGNGVFTVTKKDLIRLKSRQGNCCSVCGVNIEKKSHLDHIIPVARGGRHSIGNLQYLCGGCNFKKSSKLPIVFRYKAEGRID